MISGVQAASLPQPHTRSWNSAQTHALEELTRQLTLSTEQLEMLANEFVGQMRAGLAVSNTADLAMIPTYVTGRPDGTERGCYLALDLGGTNLRVCLITLKGDHEFETHQRNFKVSQQLQEAEVSQLMDFIAISIKDFLAHDHINATLVEHAADSDRLELGFTFSFPVSQTSLDAGMLLRWTKGYSCAGAVGNDIVQLLQSALDRNNVNVHVAALVNDTVGTLLAHAYKRPNTFLGAIFGTGTNGAYVEKAVNITKLKTTAKEMIINIEWGNFDKDKVVLPVTIYDNKLDRESINPGVHVFEKMISGMYLGEITRNILCHLIDQRLLFDGKSSSTLNRHWGIETATMSAIEEDQSPNLVPTGKIIEDAFGVGLHTITDREIVKHVCHLVGRRAARLSAVATAAVIRQGLYGGGGGLDKHRFVLKAGGDENRVQDSTEISVPPINVGIDGSVFEHYPGFRAVMNETLVELLGPAAARVVKLETTKDGSGVGAALAALMAHKTALAERK
ncbi:glucokinase [Actinomortierella wolfii]|nr:glucokinase [Actinomortierella wolfii]KAG0235214.1 glucokinase [Actinomortierella wolfii]